MNIDWLEKISPCPDPSTGSRKFEQGIINPRRILYNHELFIFEGGDCKMVIEGKDYACPDGSFIIVPPGKEHISYSLAKDPVTVHWAHFDWVFHERNEDDFHSAVIMPGKIKKKLIRRTPDFVPEKVIYGKVKSSKAYSLHRRMSSMNTDPDRRKQFMARAVFLEEILELLLPENLIDKSNNHEIRIVEKLRSELEQIANQRFDRMPGIRNILEQQGYSYFYQTRLFKKYFGVSPLAYLNAIRIEQIKELLVGTEMTVNQICRSLGFRDPAYFTRFFNKHTGQTPSGFREENFKRGLL
jgi:AraC-like DNA-binding protein